MELLIKPDNVWMSSVQAGLARMRAIIQVVEGRGDLVCAALGEAIGQHNTFHNMDFMSGLATVLVDSRLFKEDVVDVVYRFVTQKHFDARDDDPVHVTSMHFHDILLSKAVEADNLDAVRWLHESLAPDGIWGE